MLKEKMIVIEGHIRIGPLQLVTHVVKNRHTGEQEAHWVQTKRGN